MTHFARLVQNNTKRSLDTSIHLPVVKEIGYYASILLCYLMDANIEQYQYNDHHNYRLGVKWIPVRTIHL